LCLWESVSQLKPRSKRMRNIKHQTGNTGLVSEHRIRQRPTWGGTRDRLPSNSHTANWRLHFGNKYGKPGANRPGSLRARRTKTGSPGFPGLFPVFWGNLGGARPQRLFRCWISLAHSKVLDEHFHNRYGFTAISNGFQRIFVLENGQNPGLFAPGFPYLLPKCIL
jgi:hypothetical protein